MHLVVTTTPQSVAAALGLGNPNGVAFMGRCQNVDPEQTVYRLRSTTAPAPATAHAFRHPPGDRWAMSVYGAAAGLGDTWLWTSEGEATVVLEEGLPGV